MIALDLGGFKKCRIWVDEQPEVREKIIDTVNIDFEADNQYSWESREIVVELLLGARHSSNYALIGCKYSPANNGVLNVTVNISGFDGRIMEDNIALSPDEIHMGIPNDYVSSIIDAVKIKHNEKTIPSGILLFDVGAHGHVGSSKVSFLTATKILLELLSNDIKRTSPDKLKEIITCAM